jgi:hypothetical protein
VPPPLAAPVAECIPGPYRRQHRGPYPEKSETEPISSSTSLRASRLALLRLLLRVFLREMMADDTAADRTRHRVMTRIVASHAAHHCALHATRCIRIADTGEGRKAESRCRDGSLELCRLHTHSWLDVVADVVALDSGGRPQFNSASMHDDEATRESMCGTA